MGVERRGGWIEVGENGEGIVGGEEEFCGREEEERKCGGEC